MSRVEVSRSNRNYIEGSAAPDRRYLPERPAYYSREPYVPQTLSQRLAKSARRRAVAMDLRYVLFLAVATVICAAGCVMFLHLQEDLTSRVERIGGLKTQIAAIKEDNEETSKRIEISKNLVEIKEEANLMGLETPGTDQIHYYSLDTSDYMHQYDAFWLED